MPTIKGLDGIVKRKGAANDLIELTRLQVPLAEIGVGPVNRNGASRPGRPARLGPDALTDSLDQVSHCFRPYSPELTGWFDDFGHSGFPDAIGGIGRISTTFNAFSSGGPGRRPCDAPRAVLGSQRSALNGDDLDDSLDAKNLRRCPGANERGLSDGDQFTQDGTVDCDPSQTPIGP